MIRTLACFVLTLPSFLAPSAPALKPAPVVTLPDTGCVGCEGSGGAQATSSGGNCGGVVKISVVMAPGSCKWVLGTEYGQFYCRSIKGCRPTVTRSWQGLPAGSELKFCIVLNGQTLCLQTPPNAGSGTGSDERASADQSCDGDQARLFSIESPGCGLFAATETHCSSCDQF